MGRSTDQSRKVKCATYGVPPGTSWNPSMSIQKIFLNSPSIFQCRRRRPSDSIALAAPRRVYPGLSPQKGRRSLDTDGANIVGHFTPCPPISTPNICCYRCYIPQYSSSSSLATLVIFVSVHCTFPRIYYHPKVKVYLRHARHRTSKTSEQSFHCQCQRPEI